MSAKTKSTHTTDELFMGVDIGHGYTKTKLVKFASKVKVGSNLGIVGKTKKDTYAVKHNGQDYVVGDGAIFTGEERYFTIEYKLALLTAIALNNPTEDFIDITIVLGTPIERNGRVASRIAQHFRGVQETININGRDVTIRITDIGITIEGVYPVLTGEEGRVITIDMGAGTVDVTEFVEGSIGLYTTYTDSMYKMYQEIATFLNVTKGGDFRPADVEPILNRTTMTINQQRVDITDIRPIIQSHIAEIASNIKNYFNTGRADSIYLIGGGAMDTIQYWNKVFPTAKLVEDSQMINSKVFDIIAESMIREG